LTEAGIGFIASVHLFSTLDLVLPAELNAPAFLETMAVSGIQIYDHVVTVPEGPGLGVTPDEDYIKANLLDVESS
jgi:muconate cycloisomerase